MDGPARPTRAVGSARPPRPWSHPQEQRATPRLSETAGFRLQARRPPPPACERCRRPTRSSTNHWRVRRRPGLGVRQHGLSPSPYLAPFLLRKLCLYLPTWNRLNLSLDLQPRARSLHDLVGTEG